MTDERQIYTSSSEGRNPEINNQSPDEGAILKERYLRLVADLENTKKRLARISAQEVEAQREALLRDGLGKRSK